MTARVTQVLLSVQLKEAVASRRHLCLTELSFNEHHHHTLQTCPKSYLLTVSLTPAPGQLRFQCLQSTLNELGDKAIANCSDSGILEPLCGHHSLLTGVHVLHVVLAAEFTASAIQAETRVSACHLEGVGVAMHVVEGTELLPIDYLPLPAVIVQLEACREEM